MSNFSSKIASVISIVALTSTALSSSFVSAASEFMTYAEQLAGVGVINQQNVESGYRLNDHISRAELAKISANIAGIPVGDCTGTTYSDVSSNLGDLCNYIEAIAEAGIISKANATFRPSANVSRAEMVKMILGAAGGSPSSTTAGFQDVTASLGDLEGWINSAREYGVISQAQYFRPSAPASRGEVFKIAAGIIAEGGVEPGKPTEPGTSSGTTAGTGAINASSVGAATVQYVPSNASSIKVGTVKLTAQGKDATVKSIIVTRSGLGNTTDIEAQNGIRAAINGKIVSSTSDYYNSSSQQGIINFFPALTIKAGESKDLDILVSLASGSSENSQHQFTVTSIKTAGETVSGIPVSLGLVNTTGYKTATVEARLDNGKALSPGKQNQPVVDVKITSNERDVKITGFSIARASGGVSNLTRLFANATVTYEGSTIGTVNVTSDKIFVTGIDKVLTNGKTGVFQIRSDILLAGDEDEVNLKIEDAGDISGVEISTNQNVRVDEDNAAKTLTIRNAVTSFTSNTTASVTASPDDNNVRIFDGKFSSSIPLFIKTINVKLPKNTGFDSPNNSQFVVRINGTPFYKTGSTPFSAAELVAGENINYTALADENNPVSIVVEARKFGNVTPGQTGKLKAKVEISSIEDMSKNAATVTKKSLSGHETRVSTGEANFGSVSSANNNSYVISPDEEVSLGEVAISAKTEDITVEKIAFKANTTISALTDIVEEDNIKLTIDGEEIDDATLTVTNADLKFVLGSAETISENSTKKFGIVFHTTSFTTEWANTIKYTLDTSADTMVKAGTTTLTPSAIALSTTNYMVGIIPPTITVERYNDGASGNIAKVTVHNNSSDYALLPQTLELSISARGKDYDWSKTDKVNIKDTPDASTVVVSTTGTVNGANLQFDTTTLNLKRVDVNNEQVFYVDLGSAPVSSGDTFTISVKNMTYNTDAVTGSFTPTFSSYVSYTK